MIATYRLQLHRDFPLDRARQIVPYLRRLGVSHVYASPVLTARPGSTHGYDVVDPRAVNPELGGEAALRALSAELRSHGMGLVLDIVPNHMGTGASNPFWDDMLARGRTSHYANWFDVEWTAPGLEGRIMLPVLGDELPAVIARDELRVVYERGAFRVAYYDDTFPLDPATVHRLFAFAHRYDFPTDDAEQSAREMRRVRDALTAERGESLSPQRAAEAVAALVSLVDRSPAVRAYVDWLLPRFSAGDAGHYRLETLLDLQPYALTFWRRAATAINYRRFFEISDLAALRQEDPEVFEGTHARILGWVADGTVDALRIDHVDGLADPVGYLRRLRAEVARRRPNAHVPIFVEKILSGDERLRADWPVDGTTGYEFLNELEALFLDPAGVATVERGYERFTNRVTGATFTEAAVRGKELILRSSLAADVRRLTRRLLPIARASGPDAPRAGALTRALEQLIAALPVYRTYIDGRLANGEGRTTAGEGRGTTDAPGASTLHVSPEDEALVERALERTLARGIAPPDAARFVADVLLGRAPAGPSRGPRLSPLPFVVRFQQTSGPAAAKGVEDTALYRYVPLASRNEVGGDPGEMPADPALRLHEANARRQLRWPRHLLAVTTHDTKRAADVRARLDVLSEIPEVWLAHARRWARRHEPHKRRLGRRLAPEANTEYLLYQSALGIWPLVHEGDPVPAGAALSALRERLDEYLQKAGREAKLRTSWTDPNDEAERALREFIATLLEGDAGAPFRAEMTSLVRTVGAAGWWNTLARTLVHLTAPGTPDIYQGDELANLALVDPDNRRAVDYALRTRLLDELDERTRREGGAAVAAALVERPGDQRAKLFAIRAALAARRNQPALFAEGDYVALAASGTRARHAFAFARTHAGAAAVVVVPRLPLALSPEGRAPTGAAPWGDTTVALPPELARAPFRDALTGAELRADRDGTLRVTELFRAFPGALLTSAGTD